MTGKDNPNEHANEADTTSKARSANSYRAARRNASRGELRSLKLKAERLARGETRSEADRRRWKEAQGK